ncbi:SDR family oxidoreductase [Scleromatobacter humisilvae]|uniref:SDR family oxidoreductase n=1 Tax=Scleromatobacter humisilvae TaxID=2897159 RepID=A0A9X1YIZ9_9BURK|nr:SDR family oxidoreductase [Scleromatobacter humisilvae]MCK9687384.1 SDR family oxidoreductase [Scleromatobacter humisilvae]
MSTTSWQGRTAVITGAASGFGLETSRLAAQRGMNVVMADVMDGPLAAAVKEIEALGAQVLPFRCDVRNAAEIEAMGAATLARFGAPHLVFNNAGVGAGGLIWEHSARDWDWVMGVNVMGVAHGVRVFTPMMLAAEKADPAYSGHIVNTASMAGLVNMPNMGVYNVSKHAVVSLSETLYQDLRLVSDRVHAHVLAPYFVPTGIAHSERARPDDAQEDGRQATTSQRVAQGLIEKAVAGGRVTAADVAQFVFDALEAGRFYIYSHPKALAPVGTRAEDILATRNPTDPYRERPELGEQLRAALRR